MAANASFTSPLADAGMASSEEQNLVGSIIAPLVSGMSVSSVAITLVLLAVAYDQGAASRAIE